AAGYVTGLSAVRIGLAALHLGAGRRTKDDEIDHAVGIVCRAKRGDRVGAGDVLAEVHAGGDVPVDEVLAAYELGDEPPRPRPIVLETLA
ncbi:MAG: pyrimidine-nucleoside phosphorylase, partial [Thermoleophilia bacterium]|nr:pyrimidine-nucleoside phosphorylase [Thermoleophilia bacterium]